MSLEVGSIVEGRVTGITNFGAFVLLPNGTTGLVHISEVADAYVQDIKDHLNENDTIKVKIINVRDGKVGLSIRQADTPGPPVERRPAGGGSRPSSGPRRRGGGGGAGGKSFEDKLRGFMKDSDEKLTSLRRSQDSKRGGRGSRRDF